LCEFVCAAEVLVVWQVADGRAEQEWGRSGTAKDGPVVPQGEVVEAAVSAPSRSASSVSSPVNEGPTEAEGAHVSASAEAEGAHVSDSHTSSFEGEDDAREEDALSAPASPVDTSLAGFPRAATPTGLGGGAAVGCIGGGIGGAGGGMSGGGMSVGGISGAVYAFGGEVTEGLDNVRVPQWSRPQSPSEFFSWSTGEYCT